MEQEFCYDVPLPTGRRGGNGCCPVLHTLTKTCDMLKSTRTISFEVDKNHTCECVWYIFTVKPLLASKLIWTI